MKGAGGTSGGFGEFIMGLGMMGAGFYMLLSKIIVTVNFGMSHRLYSYQMAGGYNIGVTTGMIFIPMIIGIGMIFYNSQSKLGWGLSVISLIAMIFGVISSTTIRMQTMTSFDLIVILVLAFGGTGLFLRSLKEHKEKESRSKS